MKLFKETFLSIFEPIMLKYNFVRKGVIFHRFLNGQIIQMLSYKKLRDSFTIQFCICPLCAGYEYTTFMDETRLGSLWGSETCAEWDNDETKNLQYFQEALGLCEKHLFPYFEAMQDYESYITNMYKIYKDTRGEKGEDVLLRKMMLYEVGLKVGRYDIAEKSQEKNLEQAEYAIKHNRAYNIEPSPATLEKLSRRQSEYSRMKTAMVNNDRDFIESYIKAKEEFSLNSYEKNFKVKISHKI